MKNKLRKLFFLSVLTGVTLLTTIGFADTNATPENHAMGSSLIQQEQEQSESPQSASPRLRSFAAAAPAVANSLVDLSPTDVNIPSCDAVDVASYQSWMKQEDFNGLKAQGVKTIVVKLSEGTYYTNPYASAQIKMAQNAGLNIATYHYAIFGNTNNQTTANHAAIAEADYYAQAAQKLGLSTAITMVEDAENSGTTSSVWTQASQNFQSELSKKGYHNVKFYTGQSWAANGSMNSSTLGAKNFWVAQYLYGKPETNPTGWANTLKNNAQFGAWQYTSQMRYSGTSLQKNVLDTSTDFSNFFSALPLPSLPIYRLYNPNNFEHLYTSSINEKNTLIRIGWGKDEGVSFYAPITGGIPVYRLYQPRIKMHLYSTDQNERTILSKSGWKDEGIIFYADTASTGTIKVYRLYNSVIKQHLYTTDENEKNILSKSEWKYEGISWYGRNG